MRLEDVRFKTPCTVPFSSMQGDGDRVRLCLTCDRRVYNLSSMSREQAEAFLDQSEGKDCVQFYRRPDGTIVTGNCADAKRPIPPNVAPLGGEPVRPR